MNSRFYSVQAGISLIELIIYIVIVSVGVVGILGVMNYTTMHSADPLPPKQAMAIAESLLEEVQAHPYTYCDPNDASVTTAADSAGCATIVENIGAETTGGTETRYSSSTPFDNVNDYNDFSMSGISDVSNAVVTGLSSYTASVTVADASADFTGIASGGALKISVRVRYPNTTSPTTDITLVGYRFRYAPNAAG